MCMGGKLRPFDDFWEGVNVCYMGKSVSCPLSGEDGAH